MTAIRRFQQTALAALLAAVLLLTGVWSSGPANAAQGSTCMPTTGTVSGLIFSQDINAGLAALISSNSGGSAPTNTCSGLPVTGQFWLDTSGAKYKLNIYDGTAWEYAGSLDPATGGYAPSIGGGGNSIASAATVDLWSVPESYVTVSGTTTISKLVTSTNDILGTMKVVKFSGILTLTYNATQLILPGAASITTAAGDQAVVVSLGGDNAAVVAYTRADGSSITASTFSSAVTFSGIITASSLSGTLSNWAPSGIATASTVRASPSSTTIITGITAGSDGALLFLENISTSVSITLSDETTSTAANRFSFGADFALLPQQTVLLRYDGTLARWVLGANSTNQPSSAYVPIGTVMDYAGGSAPTNYLLLYGQAISRTTYADLFAILGTTYGSGNGSTTFNLPDLRGRVVAGQDDMGGSSANRLTGLTNGVDGDVLGDTGGEQAHTLTTAQIPAHTHTITTDGTRHGANGLATSSFFGADGNTSTDSNIVSQTSSSTGGGGSHNVVQPTLILNKIIRAL